MDISWQMNSSIWFIKYIQKYCFLKFGCFTRTLSKSWILHYNTYIYISYVEVWNHTQVWFSRLGVLCCKKEIASDGSIKTAFSMAKNWWCQDIEISVQRDSLISLVRHLQIQRKTTNSNSVEFYFAEHCWTELEKRFINYNYCYILSEGHRRIFKMIFKFIFIIIYFMRAFVDEGESEIGKWESGRMQDVMTIHT